jgi:hypothetical protein
MFIENATYQIPSPARGDMFHMALQKELALFFLATVYKHVVHTALGIAQPP